MVVTSVSSAACLVAGIAEEAMMFLYSMAVRILLPPLFSMLSMLVVLIIMPISCWVITSMMR